MQPGSTFAHYSVVDRIGAGGMGEVFRAHDTKLRRDVALKVLPAEFADDPERMARFKREAQTLAALQHPNVASIFGLEEIEGHTFLVMELVEGGDLDQRLKQGPMEVAELLAVAAQISAGLEAAHERGIVHRDLKPANVMLTPEGQVKILDFGLARAYQGDSTGEENISHSPTLTAAMTGAGVILGTAAYMSPEQARALPVDRRADIWALGVILFELLTGRRLFQGATISDTLAAVLREEPDWDSLPADLPPRALRLLTRALDRDPKRRLRDAGEMRVAFERPDELLAESAVAATVPGDRGKPWVWAIALLAGMALAAGGAWLGKPGPTPVLRKLELGLDIGSDLNAEKSGLAISPDGTHIAYVDSDKLWIRRLDQIQSQEVSDTEGASRPTWSPDGQWLAFVVKSTIWKIPHTGGQRIRIGQAPSVLGAAAGLAWHQDGQIYLSTGNAGLHAIPAAGGNAEVVTQVDATQEQDYHDASGLPDGRGIIYVIHRLDKGISALGVWDGEKTQQVFHLPGELLKNPAYSSSGHILYAMGDADTGIWAVPFSLASLEVTGDPFMVAQLADVPSVSRTGNLVYLSGNAVSREHELLLVDREGNLVHHFGRAPNIWPFPSLAPGANEAVALVRSGPAWDMWVHDRRGGRMRLSDNATEEDGPVVSPDGKRVYYVTGRSSDWRVARRAMDGTGAEEFLVSEKLGPRYDGASIWVSPDETFLLYSNDGGEAGNDIARLDLTTEGAEPEVIYTTPANELAARLSPDGRFMAYVSNSTGNYEVYLAQYPTGAGRRQVSVDGGMWPRWRDDGGEIYFVSADSLVAVEVDLKDRPLIGTPRRLFSVGPTVHSLAPDFLKSYDMTPDGELFLYTRQVENEEQSNNDTRIVHVENWVKEFQ